MPNIPGRQIAWIWLGTPARETHASCLNLLSFPNEAPKPTITL